MNVLSIGYYDDFARFFLEIKKELIKKDNKIEFKYLTLYLSGFLYWKIHNNNTSFYSMKVWINALLNRKKYRQIIAEHSTYKDIDLDKIISYHVRSGNSQADKLKLQAISYIDVYEKLFDDFCPDVIISSGDSRMAVEILIKMAEQKNIKLYYFEQGPFGTTFIDTQGVNANASIRTLNIPVLDQDTESLEKEINAFYTRQKSAKHQRNKIYRASDYLFQGILNMIGLLPPDILMEVKKEKKFIAYDKLTKTNHSTKNVFLLVLQVPYDVNMIYHSPFFSNHFSIVKSVYENLPEDSILIVREHPLYQGKYEKELYRYMIENSIPLDDMPLYDSIDKADVIIVNNSTVGIEAISRYKPTIVLGNAYYDRESICLKLHKREDLNKIMQKALHYQVDKKEVNEFLKYYLYNYLINGHFRDENIHSAFHIAEKIINDK